MVQHVWSDFLRKLICITICLLLLTFTGCDKENASSVGSVTETVNPPIQAVTPYKTVIFRQKTKSDTPLDSAYITAYTQSLSYAENSGKEFEVFETDEQNALTDMISQAVSGAKTFICFGNIYSDAVELCSQSYANLNFILFDGTIPENKVQKNVLQFTFAYDEAGFVMGYCLVNAGIRNIGFVADEMGYYESEIIKGITAGAGYAANEKNNPPVSSSSDASSIQSTPAVTNKPTVNVTIEKYLLSNLNESQITTALDIRKDLKNLRIVCIGDNAAASLVAHPGQFYMLTDSDTEYPRKHLQFGIGGVFDIIPELEKLSTAGEGWASAYGGRTVRLSVMQENIIFPVFKLSTTNLSKAKAVLTDPTTDLNSDRMKKGFGYVTQTEYKAS